MESLLETFTKDILTIDAEKLKSEWNESLGKWFVPRFFGQNKIIKVLKDCSKIEN